MPERILVIDDDARLAAMLASYLEARNFSVEQKTDGLSGLQALQAREFDAVILDVMLPDLDGFEICRRIRAHSQVPVLMLTARGDDLDRIVGLEIGADDYLSKPFNPRELLARLSAILRRSRRTATEAPLAAEVLRFGRLSIDRQTRAVQLDGERKDLTGRQFDILLLLAERAGRIQSREQLMEALKGEQGDAFDRSIDVHISRIRGAIEDDPKHPRFVQTVRGAGYVFTPPRAGEPEPRDETESET